MSVVRHTVASLLDRHVMKQTEQKQTERDSSAHQRETRASNKVGVVGTALRCCPASYPRTQTPFSSEHLG